MDSSRNYEVNTADEEERNESDKPRSVRGKVMCLVWLLLVAVLVLVIAVVVIAINAERETKELREDLAKVEEKLDQQPIKPTEPPTYNDVCLTENCVQAAARLRGAMDDTIDPCEDFYNFACGTWIKKHMIPDDAGGISTISVLREEVATTIKSLLEEDVQPTELEAVVKAKTFYQACVNETIVEDAGLTYLYSVLEDLGGWPVLMSSPGGSWDVNSYSFEKLFLKSYVTAGGDTAILGVSVDVDAMTTTKHSIQISQPVLGLPSRDYFLKGRNDPAVVAYRTFLEQSAILFGADPSKAAEDAQHVVDMEIELANISVTAVALRDPKLSYNQILLGELGNNFTGIDWYTLVTGILEGTELTVNMSEPVVAIAPPYLAKAGEIIEKYPPRVITNYVIWRHVTASNIIPFLPATLRALHQDLTQVISGSTTPDARWRLCSSISMSYLPDVVGRIFVTESFKPEAKADVLAMSSVFKLAFKQMVNEATWMDAGTKEIAKEKMELMGTIVGYPDLLYNDNALNEKYEDMTLDATSPPLAMFQSIRKTTLIQQQSKLRTLVDKNEWIVSPAYASVFYLYGNNQIVFPAAILQTPIYQHDTTGYLSYGSLGYLMGIISMFAYSTTGRNYDQYGQLNPWWTEGDVSNFESRQQCFIDQYNNFTVPGTGGLTINGASTLIGNIADSAAMRQAFKGYQVWVSSSSVVEKSLPGVKYTPEQLFFLGAAQTMCGSYRKEAAIQEIYRGRLSLLPYRVYGPLQNMEEFSKAWNCPVGSYMNPEKKCKIW